MCPCMEHPFLRPISWVLLSQTLVFLIVTIYSLSPTGSIVIWGGYWHLSPWHDYFLSWLSSGILIFSLDWFFLPSTPLSLVYKGLFLVSIEAVAPKEHKRLVLKMAAYFVPKKLSHWIRKETIDFLLLLMRFPSIKMKITFSFFFCLYNCLHIMSS